jgi:hypothetical protein
MRSANLKQQDIVLAVHLLRDERFRKQTEYAEELGICQAEISSSLKRLINARLIDPELQLPYRKNLKEFLIHGLKYAFPVRPGPIVKGVATAHSALPLSNKMRSSGIPVVWPSDSGKVQGQAVEPLYPSVPEIVRRQSALYEVLALIDSLRLGKAREQTVAIEELEKRL